MGGLSDLIPAAGMIEGMAKLGYPAYLLSILGVWKLLGAAAIAAPRFARLKEWAYAGMVLDLTGAAFSHAASGDGAGKVMTPLFLVALVATSWALRPQSRMLMSPLRATERPLNSAPPKGVPLPA
jgi:uncharacterized membrane protein YphA (DoxX/SURF4 family)